MDGNASNNVIDLSGNPIISEPQTSTSHRPERRNYRAIEYDETSQGKGNEEWFRVHGDPNDMPNSVELYRYVDILKVYSPVHEMLLIVCEDASLHIEGQHLDEIPLLIQDRRLRAIYLFQPLFHVHPNEDAPLIQSLERISMIDEVIEGSPE